MSGLVLMIVLIGAAGALAAAEGPTANPPSEAPLAQRMALLDGTAVALDQRYRGQVVLVVNVASRCGLTPQYAQLEALYQAKQAEGLRIAAFPCNQFGQQEPGSAEEIRAFCSNTYGVSFDLFAKVEVNGESACALYRTLTAAATEPVGPGPISWNFEKFLIGADGAIIARFGPRTPPNDPALVAAVDAALAARP